MLEQCFVLSGQQLFNPGDMLPYNIIVIYYPALSKIIEKDTFSTDIYLKKKRLIAAKIHVVKNTVLTNLNNFFYMQIV